MFSARVVIFLAAIAVCYGAPNHLRVDGGTNAKIEDYPYIVAVYFAPDGINSDSYACGGIIVNKNWVLTSATCASLAHGPTVVIGTADLNADDNVTVNVEAVFPHPGSYYVIGPDDIGLIKLSEPLTFSDKVQPAKLPSQGQEFSGKTVMVAYGGNRTHLTDLKLRVVSDLPLISYDDCKATLHEMHPNVLPAEDDTFICTLNKAAKTCGGDHGGPLSQNGTVIGITAWFVNGCGSPGVVDVYTNVANFVDWINETIEQNN